MAVDETLLAGVAGAPAWTLRFYLWRRPTVSLGYAQPFLQGVDERARRRQGIEVVRRLTGGRAVLHADELTYALGGPTDDGRLSGGASATYMSIASGLRDGVRRLGAEVDLGRSAPPPRRSEKGPCFSARARHELAAHGRKLIGSAQRRRDGRLLQHGSMPLGAPDPRLWRALGPGYEDAAAASIGLAEVLGRRPPCRAVAGCLARGLAASLDLEVRWGSLTRAEKRHAKALECRYRDRDWTHRR